MAADEKKLRVGNTWAWPKSDVGTQLFSPLLGGPIGTPRSRLSARDHRQQVFPDHRTVIFEGAGHFIQEDAPDEIVAAIRNWQGSPAG